MTRLVSKVIEESRDWDSSFDPVRQPPGPLYRRLAAICQSLQGQLTALDPALSSIELTLTYQLPLADFDAGLALGRSRLVTDVVLVDPATANPQHTYPVTIIPRDQRHFISQPIRAVWQEGSRLYLRGPAQRYANFTGTIEVRVVQSFGDVEIEALQLPGAPLPLPDEVADAAVVALAAFMGQRSTPKIDLTAAAEAARVNAMSIVAQRVSGLTVMTEPWYP